MVDRIKSIMEYYHLSSAQFADRIGFQRSALSHVLSGRNNPSLDFVLKVKAAFPDIDLDWLTMGKGNLFVNQVEHSGQPAAGGGEPESSAISEKEMTASDEGKKDLMDGNLPEEPDRSQQITAKYQEIQEFRSGKRIKKIILLYEDGSFSEHIPEK